MKLTNLQLEVLSNNIYNNLLERKEQANKIKIAKYKPSADYKKAKKLLEDIKDLNITIKSLREQVSELATSANTILKKHDISTWGTAEISENNNVEHRLHYIKLKELNIQNDNVNMADIRSEIVMATIDKKFDLEVIIEELAKKFKVDE